MGVPVASSTGAENENYHRTKLDANIGKSGVLKRSLENDTDKTGDSKQDGEGNILTVTFGVDGKPNLSYAELIKRAIESSPMKKMTLNEIYKWITDNFAYYRDQDSTSWKNSIRHNLSLNKQFLKVQRNRGDPGKGSYWKIDDTANDTWRARRPRTFGQAAAKQADQLSPMVVTEDSSGSSQDQQQLQHRQQEIQKIWSPQSTPSQGEHFGSSWTSQNSLPSNYRFPDLDSSVGSVQSQLGESFKHLYHQALNASFNSSMAAAFPLPAAAVQDGMLVCCAHPNHDENSMASPQQIAMQMEDQPGPSHVHFPLAHDSQSAALGFQERAADWLRQVAAAEPQAPPPPPPAELFQSLDTGQFQNMMGSMQSKDLQEYLRLYNENLSWQDFLTKSIGGGLCQSHSQAQIWKHWTEAATHQQKVFQNCELAPTPPAISIDGDEPTCAAVGVPSPKIPVDRAHILDKSMEFLQGMATSGNPLLYSMNEDDRISPRNLPSQCGSRSTENNSQIPDDNDDSGSDFFDWEDLVNRE